MFQVFKWSVFRFPLHILLRVLPGLSAVNRADDSSHHLTDFTSRLVRKDVDADNHEAVDWHSDRPELAA